MTPSTDAMLTRRARLRVFLAGHLVIAASAITAAVVAAVDERLFPPALLVSALVAFTVGYRIAGFWIPQPGQHATATSWVAPVDGCRVLVCATAAVTTTAASASDAISDIRRRFSQLQERGSRRLRLTVVGCDASGNGEYPDGRGRVWEVRVTLLGQADITVNDPTDACRIAHDIVRNLLHEVVTSDDDIVVWPAESPAAPRAPR